MVHMCSVTLTEGERKRCVQRNQEYLVLPIYLEKEQAKALRVYLQKIDPNPESKAKTNSNNTLSMPTISFQPFFHQRNLWNQGKEIPIVPPKENRTASASAKTRNQPIAQNQERSPVPASFRLLDSIVQFIRSLLQRRKKVDDFLKTKSDDLQSIIHSPPQDPP